MKLFFRYFLLELKRSVRMLKKMLSAFGVMALLLALLSVCLTGVMKRLAVLDTASVGMVISEEDQDENTMFVMSFLAAQASVKSISSFRYYDTKEEAIGDLTDGKLSVVIVLPPYFYEDVDSGINTPAEIYLAEDAGVSTRAFAELITAGVRLLAAAEAGAYAMLDEAYENRPSEGSWSSAGNKAAYEYMENWLLRDGTFDNVVLSAFGEQQLEEYYFTAGLLCFLLFAGLSFAHLYRKNSRAFTQKLSSEGFGPWRLSCVKILVMTIFLWGLGCAVYLLGYAISAFSQKDILYWDAFIPAVLFVLAFSMACYFHLIFCAAGGDAGGCAVLLAANAFLVLVSGLLIPVSYLPAAAQNVSGYLPLYRWNLYALSGFFLDDVPQETGMILCVSTLAAAAGSLLYAAKESGAFAKIVAGGGR